MRSRAERDLSHAKRTSPAECARLLEAAKAEPLVALGMVMGSHGLHGELRVKRFNEESDLLVTRPTVIVRHKGALQVVDVLAARPADRGLYMQLSGTESIEKAKTMHGAELCILRSELPALNEGEFYYTDLDGLEARLPDGTRVGLVETVHEYPASTVLRVALATGVVEVPMRPPYLVAVNVPAGHVVVDQLDDLEVEAPRRGA